MKEWLTKNLGLKIGSVIIAFFIWMSVINIANPNKLSSREVQIEIINASVLENANLAYEIVGKRTATVKFNVRTTDDYKITASDFKAVADVAQMYEPTGAIPIQVSVLNHKALLDANTLEIEPKVIRINTEPLQTKDFKVQAYSYGEPEDGFMEGAVNISPSIVSVKGPESLVGQISTVGIEYSIASSNGDREGYATPQFYDANGNRLELDDSVVSVIGGDVYYTAQILKIKTVPLDFVVVGEAAEGYKFTGVSSPVTEVAVAGLKSDVATLNKITITDPVLVVNGATSNVTATIDIKKYVEQGITIAGLEDTEIQIVLQVEKLEEKVYTANPEDIMLNGTSDSYDYRIDIVENVIRLEGLKEDLEEISPAKMNLYVDVNGLTAGEHLMAVHANMSGAYDLIEAPLVRVFVSEKE